MSSWVYVLIGIISLLSSIFGGFLYAYFRKKGEQTAIMEDLNDIKTQLEHTTETIETVKASISKNLHIEKSKWDLKKEIYYDLLTSLSELRACTIDYGYYLKDPKNSERKDSSFQKMCDSLDVITKNKELGGIFIDQSIMDEVSQLAVKFSEINNLAKASESIWDKFIDTISNVITKLTLKAKKDLLD